MEGGALRRWPLHDRLGGTQVFLQKKWRQRQDIANVIKAVTHIVLREIVRRFEIHTHEVANGVIVFGPVHPPERHAAGIGVVGIDGKQGMLDPGGHHLTLGLRGLGLLFLGRHVSASDILEDAVPGPLVGDDLGDIGETVQRQIALGRAIAVAIPAILFEQWQDLLLKVSIGASPVHAGQMGVRT